MFRLIKSVWKSIKRAVYGDPEVQNVLEKHPRFFGFLRRRLSPDEKFGWHLTLGTIVAIICLYLFFGFIQDLIGQDYIIQSDLRLINLVQIFRTPFFNNLMLLVTYFGKWQIVFVGVAATIVILALLRYWYYAFLLVVSTAGGEFFVWLLKNLIKRPRPPLVNALAPEGSFSLPSGHSFVAFSFYGLLTYFLFNTTKSRFLRVIYIIFGAGIILAIGFSRIYLGAHWPSDVLASYALGLAWLAILITSVEIRERSDDFQPKVPYTKKYLIALIGILLFGAWANYVFFYFQAHSLKTPPAAEEKQTIISEKNIPQDLFVSLPRASEDITGKPMEPINIIIVSSQASIDKAMKDAGWLPTDPFSFNSLWRMVDATIFNKPYAQAPGTPSFWDFQPNEFSYAQATPANTVDERHHIHFWKTPFVLKGDKRVWFATVHFDKGIKSKFKIPLPIHAIDPAIDKEREKVRNDLLKTNEVGSIQEMQIVEPELGSNQAGDQFFTDGKAYVIFLKS